MRIKVSESVSCALQLDEASLNAQRRIKVQLLRRGAWVEGDREAFLGIASELEVFDDFDTPAGLRAARMGARRLRELVEKEDRAS